MNGHRDIEPAGDSLPVIRGLGVAYVLSLLVAGLLVVTSIAGLIFGRQGLYNPDPKTLPTFLGQDGITLAFGLPLLLGAVWATRRDSLRGLLLWQAALFYVAYSYSYYVLNPEFNVLYLAYIAIVSMSVYGFVYLLVSTDAEAVRARFSAGTPVRVVGGFLMAIPLLLSAAWVAMVISHLASGAVPNRVNQVVWAMDLVVAFPALFWGGVWIWRRQALGYLVAAVLLVKGGSVGLTLVVNTYLATLWGLAPDPMVPVYAVGGVLGLGLAFVYLRHVDPAGEAGSNSARSQEEAAYA
jgi:hypothetical protein